MKLGDLVKAILKPFVKNTKYENCSACERRRQALNTLSDKVWNFITAPLCPCFWRGLKDKIMEIFRKK